MTLYQWIVAAILALTSLLLIMSVLLHKGKGGGLSDMFGGGVSGGLQGSSVVERNLDRISVVLSIVWITCIVALGLMYKHNF
ncbi:preprotein translocase subunit SecG [Catenulispora sp. NF23]|uniref:Protein-export membrane protein SecG n=1 Tax=Catenulispora pinistramenti TaxID=2705254 RepID=A0ABS5KZZ3_9ACTN|nr:MULTISPECIES: preprotein translocase subunit SecG [Catenulispora]MBS2536790.1 preprotein translocase subunit SecG [Catenulispora pinistramenti]MBS2551560.1 preprotein translocase subunit SecG [Catenulispora pinistramenti]